MSSIPTAAYPDWANRSAAAVTITSRREIRTVACDPPVTTRPSPRWRSGGVAPCGAHGSLGKPRSRLDLNRAAAAPVPAVGAIHQPVIDQTAAQRDVIAIDRHQFAVYLGLGVVHTGNESLRNDVQD